MASVAQILDLNMWSGVLHADFGALQHAAFWIAVPQIVLINILLSGDNAVVIAMACRALPQRQRFWGAAIGAGFSAVLLIVFATIVTKLLFVPGVRLAGGIALILIAAKLVAPETADRNRVEAAAHLWGAVRVVVVADIIMSLDNIIAVAAVAKGNMVLLAIGLAVSIPIVLAGAALAMALLDRFQILVWVGAALLGWVAGDTIAAEPVVAAMLKHAFGGILDRHGDVALAAAGAVLAVAVGAWWRHWRFSRSRRRATGENEGGAHYK